MIVLSSFATPEAQLRILSLKGCAVYLTADKTGDDVQELKRREPNIQFVQAPKLDKFLNENPAHAVEYQKSWENGKDNPWLIFHTSGTTGT